MRRAAQRKLKHELGIEANQVSVISYVWWALRINWRGRKARGGRGEVV